VGRTRATPVGPLGQEPGDWVDQTPTLDMSTATVTPNGSIFPVTEYFEQKPWRRTYFVLDRFTGQEITFDFDNDGNPEYAPMLWFGSHSGNRYPPIVGGDDVLYQTNSYLSDPWIPGGHISGWTLGTPYISVVSADWGAVDEPHAYSAGGDILYWNLIIDRQSGGFNLSIPFTNVYLDNGVLIRPRQYDREWFYHGYNLNLQIPGYEDERVYYLSENVPGVGRVHTVFGSPYGIYGYHGDNSPPIPYKGRIYSLNSNGIMVFAPQQISNPPILSMAISVDVQDSNPEIISRAEVQARLETEIQKIISAGHLRPGYHSTGIADDALSFRCGDDLLDYWSNPSDTIITLIRVLPHLPPSLQQSTRDYIQSEFNAYPPHLYNHIGWRDGAQRELFDTPPEFEAARIDYGPEGFSHGSAPPWRRSPRAFYALWKYAEEFGNATEIFDTAIADYSLRTYFNSVPADDVLINDTYYLNAYIAAYRGYLELERLAGYPESSNIRTELNRLLNLRANNINVFPEHLFTWIRKLLNIYVTLLQI